MIRLDFEAILKSIGPKHGIPETHFQKVCKAAQPLLKTILSSGHKNGYGFLDLPDDQGLVRQLNALRTAQFKKKWGAVVVLGIGGSALGLRAIKEALLGPFYNKIGKPELIIVDNIDPWTVERLLTVLDFKKTLFIVISKSGTTVEPMALYEIFRKKIMQAGPKKVRDYFVFITDPGAGALRKIATQGKIQSFGVPGNVGGRFSVLSSVGLVPAVLTGIDVPRLLKGARDMKKVLQKKQGPENPAIALAVVQHLMDKEKRQPMTVLISYGRGLFRFADWYRQLLAESIGKKKNAGPTPVIALGATDQHSQLQLWNEGPDNKFFIFLTARKRGVQPKVGKGLPKELAFLEGKSVETILAAAYEGTRQSLTKHERPHITVDISNLNEESLGALFFLFEVQVALLGQLYGVNAFDQPGVEESKKIMKQILSTMKED